MESRIRPRGIRRIALGRWASVGVVALVALTLSACGGTGGPGSSSSANAGSSGASSSVNLAQYIGHPSKALCGGKQYTFGYDAFSDTDAFQVVMWQGLQRVAKQLGCVKLHKLIDNADPATAVQNARIFAQEHVTGAVLFNVVQAASQGQTQVLKAAHIPVVSLAVPAQGAPFITNDDHSDGLKAGTALGKAFEAKHKGGKAYAIIGRYDGQTSTKQRMDGATEGLKQTVPGVHILPVETKADPPTANAVTAAVLPRVPANATILAVGGNDDLTYAMYQAIKHAGRQNQAMMMAIGGAYPSGMNFMCQNRASYVGDIGFFPEHWANYLLPALIAEIRGAKVPSKVIIPTTLITPANVDQFYPSVNCH